MKLTVYNGSPRGKSSNSSVIIRWLMEETAGMPEVEAEIIFLNKIENHQLNAMKMQESDISLVVFPLYTDCMPGIVAAFFEKLQMYTGKLAGRKLGFVVHSGFIEAHHSRFIEKYLIGLAKKLGADYMGTAIMGGSEPVRMMSDSMQAAKKALFNRLGEKILKEEKFDELTVKKIAGTEKLSGFMLLTYKIIARIGLTNMYWNSELKRNNVYKKRFARPYAD